MKTTPSRLKQSVRFDWSSIRFVVAFIFLAGLLTGCQTAPKASALKTRNVFLITTDGLRWQEMFTGPEEALLDDKTANGNPERMKLLFWKATPEERRMKLLPFFWSEVAAQGQLYGNQLKGSVARVTNGRNISYPGYSEFLTGVADPRIDSNAARPNPNTNVFEWLNTLPRYHGKIAAAVNWNVIPWILNTPRSQLPVWSGYVPPPGAPPFPVPQVLDEVSQDITPIFSGLNFDAFTIHAALDYVKRHRPRAFYLALGETDEWAHEGKYDRYLITAKRADLFIHMLWETCQSLPQYRDKTTFVITTDHGRGSGMTEWKNHGEKIAGSENTWVAIIGPDTPVMGERTNCSPVTASQIAATVAALLGEDYHAAFPSSGAPLMEAIQPAAR